MDRISFIEPPCVKVMRKTGRESGGKRGVLVGARAIRMKCVHCGALVSMLNDKPLIAIGFRSTFTDTWTSDRSDLHPSLAFAKQLYPTAKPSLSLHHQRSENTVSKMSGSLSQGNYPEKIVMFAFTNELKALDFNKQDYKVTKLHRVRSNQK